MSQIIFDFKSIVREFSIICFSSLTYRRDKIIEDQAVVFAELHAVFAQQAVRLEEQAARIAVLKLHHAKANNQHISESFVSRSLRQPLGIEVKLSLWKCV